jgi:hypothetical protein
MTPARLTSTFSEESEAVRLRHAVSTVRRRHRVSSSVGGENHERVEVLEMSLLGDGSFMMVSTNPTAEKVDRRSTF